MSRGSPSHGAHPGAHTGPLKHETACRPDPGHDPRATLDGRDLVIVEAVEPRLPEIGTGWLQRTLGALGVLPMSQYPYPPRR